MIKVGIIGCGAIGGVIADAIVNRFKGSITLLGVSDINEKNSQDLIKRLGLEIEALKQDELIKRCDFIVESASGSVSYEIAKEALQAGKSIIVMSTGGLLNKPDIFEIAEKSSGKLYIPSGAICGLDALKAAMMASVRSVTLTTKKPPKGLAGAPYIAENKIDLNSIKNETVIFEGTAVEAVKGFPKNVNVAATLSLCGLGAKKTIVRIVTSPDYTSNTHEVEIEGDFGRLKTVTNNVPMPANPKTSYLAALSAIAVLDGIISSVKIGN
ncbi:MAG: aspartate dehydrogenase [Candidatus Omnitrophica bacterium]|nr:aspartate dehydrogenase [Candidatus Omnitrophota bacterium]MBU4488913.1 aspartate dehydrogenase [Candidatus Omnitrophota bacterium]MCG2705309.1 aspartate dehydrogenase [Candidatus Omnitrophota bacterium]